MTHIVHSLHDLNPVDMFSQNKQELSFETFMEVTELKRQRRCL
jgi:hypothetical protein